MKRRFDLDDEYLEDLKAELIDAEQVARDEDGKVLVWVGVKAKAESENRGNGESEKDSLASSVQSLGSEGQDSSGQTLDARPSDPRQSAGERRQLTVLFCDLVGSTKLSAQLDPEEYSAVVQAHHDACTDVVRRYDGHIAQHLGDGLLVYFGYPVAHEDDAQRAIRTGLEIIEALRSQFPSPLRGEGQGEGTSFL